MADIEFDISPETFVTPVRGEETDPHLSPLDTFMRSKEVEKFKNRFCGKKSPDEFLDWWLDKELPSIGGITPRSAILSGDDELVALVHLRIKQNMR